MRLLLLIISTLATFTIAAQRPIGLAYYDVDRLYDTIPALFYNDTDFTPKGRMKWNKERYDLKITQTAALLDSMAMELVAISGIETETVVRDLVSTCNQDYSYIHRTFNTFDGLDIALLYHGDRFMPTTAEVGRGWLYIEGRLDGVKIGIILCRDARYATSSLKESRQEHPNIPIIAAGRLSAKAGAECQMVDAHARAERAGRGTIRYATGWRMSDRILADSSLPTHSGDVYARHWLMDLPTGAPLPTYTRTAYRGGCSRSLPVYTYFTLETQKNPL